MLTKSKVMKSYFYASHSHIGVQVMFSLFWCPFKKLKSDCNQTWVKDAIGIPLYVNVVLVSGWSLIQLCFESYFYASYFDIGVSLQDTATFSGGIMQVYLLYFPMLF